jgi:chaperonin cofactor prefoldin
MDLLNDDSVVFKLVGPVLVKQEVDDAKLNVTNRLKFINAELYVDPIRHCTAMRCDAMGWRNRLLSSVVRRIGCSIDICALIDGWLVVRRERIEKSAKDLEAQQQASREKIMKLQDTFRAAEQATVQKALGSSAAGKAVQAAAAQVPGSPGGASKQ